ncbi:hypothetical protein [Burkholderia sp. BCC1988]|uniref:hypothetical protein n=1 Tax=Burkholderia sp. BCC1988 TaxID=2817443 RepID=UPI002AB1712D|nr:hypothetical protein [Burkholderia sp. BCC1988]
MPVVKHFTQAQWDAVARRLDALPHKPAHEHRVTVREAVKSMQSQISGAQKKGYTLDEIVQQLAQEGVNISASTLRYAMQRSAKEDKSKPAKKSAQPIRANSVSRSGPDRAPASHRDRIDDGGQRDGRQAVTKAGTMVIQDAFSFEIAPDTENL